MTRRDELRILRLRVDRELRKLDLEPRPRKRQKARHGTASGYARHIRKRLPFPEDQGRDACGCREAHAAAEAHRRPAREARIRARLAAGDLTAETPYRKVV